MTDSVALAFPKVTIMQFGRSILVNASTPLRYLTVTSFLAAAYILRRGLSSIVVRPLGEPLFLTAIIISTWLGGFRLGIYASVVAGLILDFFFVQPTVGTLGVSDHIIRFVLFTGQGVLVSWLIERLRLAGEELSSSRDELRELAEQHRSERDAEQRRIAREIHDELGQALTGIKFGIHLAKRKVESRLEDESESAVASEFDQLLGQVDSTMDAVRRISTELRPSILDDFGLVAAIEWQTNEFQNKSGIECIFSASSQSFSVTPDASTAIFRIFQEAMTNIVRHAHATSIKVKIFDANGRICLRVEDNGKGIESISPRGTKSLGLLGMRERARLIGGEISITKPESGGTRVELLAPLEKTVSLD